MAEVLGVASSIAGLVTIADVIVRRGYKHFKDVKDADKTVKKLIAEVNSLSGVLHSCHNVVAQLEDGAKIVPSIQIHFVEACYQTLSTIQGHLEKAVPDLPLSRAHKITWPLKSSHTKELVAEVERHKATMSLAIGATEM